MMEGSGLRERLGGVVQTWLMLHDPQEIAELIERGEAEDETLHDVVSLLRQFVKELDL